MPKQSLKSMGRIAYDIEFWGIQNVGIYRVLEYTFLHYVGGKFYAGLNSSQQHHTYIIY